jgi:small-conductance mechanosensitive channel
VGLISGNYKGKQMSIYNKIEKEFTNAVEDLKLVEQPQPKAKTKSPPQYKDASVEALVARIEELNRSLRKVQDRLGKVRVSNKSLKKLNTQLEEINLELNDENVELTEVLDKHCEEHYLHVGLGFYRKG